MNNYLEQAAISLADSLDEALLFDYTGWRRTKAGVLDLHKYKGRGRPKKSDYVELHPI